MDDLFLATAGKAVISECEIYRYRLDRHVQGTGPVYAYFGVNGSIRDHALKGSRHEG